MKKCKIIVIVNRKGGCGKTTTTKNLGYDLARLGNRVLIADFDPQCNSTDGLSTRKFKKTVLGLLKNEDVKKSIYKTRFENLDILPGSDYLASEEIQDNVIREQFEKIRNEYDYILIDSSPYFNQLIAELLSVHDLVIIPCEIEEDSIKGMLTTINELQTLDNNAFFRILYTKVTKKKYLQKSLNELYETLGSVSFHSQIRFDETAIKRSRNRRIPLSKRYARAKATKDYEALAEEVENLFQEEK